MPIPIVCSGCSTKLNAPDTAAGRKVKCPKCHTPIAVPAPDAGFEVVEDEPQPAAKAPRKPVAADDDRPRKGRRRDVEDDEDDAPPRKKGKKAQKAAGVSPALLYGGIAAAVLVVGFAVYWFALRGDSGGSGGGGGGAGGGGAGGGALPEGWKEFVSAQDGFKAHFPDEPKPQSTARELRTIGNGGEVFYRTYTYNSHVHWPSLSCSVKVIVFPPTSTPQQQQAYADLVCTPAPGETLETVSGQKKATLGGVEGKEAVGTLNVSQAGLGPKTKDGRDMPSKRVSVNRWIVTNNRCYHLRVQGHETPPKDAEAFFANFALTDPPKTPDPDPKAQEPKEPPKPVTVPSGWVAFQPAGAGFKTFMPAEVKVEDVPTELPTKNGQRMLQSVKRYRGTDPDGNLVCEVCVVRFAPATVTENDRVNAIHSPAFEPTHDFKRKLSVGASKSLTWASRPAREWVFLPPDRGATRETHWAEGGFTAAIYGTKDKIDPEKVRAFFDSFELTEERSWK